MPTTSNLPPQPATAALRIGGAAALAFAAMLTISALVGAPATGHLHSDARDGMPSQSAAASPELIVTGERR